ncbi:MAG: hypothetical protein KJS97_12120 [Alphaproteobacteria bacterium]|nr:hypothetical protein [Alphaproteobacteria bacterium]
MNLKLVFAAAAGLAFLSAPAYADGLAKLAAPVSKPVKVIADSAVFVCQGDTCTGTLTKPATVRGCKAIAKEAGAVVSYAKEDKALTADELAKCNASTQAKAAATTTVAAN